MRSVVLWSIIVMLVATSVLCFVSTKIIYGRITFWNYASTWLLSLVISSIIRCIVFLFIRK